MTVQELKYYLEHLPNDREVQVFGGQMNTYSRINQIATNFHDAKNQKGGVVLFIAGGFKLPEPLKLPPAPPVRSRSIVGRILHSLVGDD